MQESAETPSSFTEEEKKILSRYFTNLEGPVFALRNLPEVVKGALFARYSRSSKDLRRLFLDEFVRSPERAVETIRDYARGIAREAGSLWEVDSRRAEQLYERIFAEYGDDSVAQLGGAHLACEDVSNVVTKIIERGRLMAYLEQSTRYIRYDQRVRGRYRYRCPPELESRPEKGAFVSAVERAFAVYSQLFGEVVEHLFSRFPRKEDEPEPVYESSIRAKACDVLRGLLPTATLANVGIFGSGQAYERLLLRMLTSDFSEAREYGALMYAELRKVIPSFVRRVELPDKGGAWRKYLVETRASVRETVSKLVEGTARDTEPTGESEPELRTMSSGGLLPEVRLVDFDRDGERKIASAILFQEGGVGAADAKRIATQLEYSEICDLLRRYAGRRGNRRHLPGRAFEATSYTFEVISDYGAFRDLQRHRMLTIEWQRLTPDLGYTLPSLVEEIGGGDSWKRCMEAAADVYRDIESVAGAVACYVLPMAYRIRYTMQMNAREAMYLIELRTSEQAHPEYRQVCREMARLIRDVAGHRGVHACLDFMGDTVETLERRKAEARAYRRRMEARQEPSIQS